MVKLKGFAEVNEPKTFHDITRQDIIDFLDSYRKPESVDPLHKWMGTYEVYRIALMGFFRWLYAPDLPHREQDRRLWRIFQNPRENLQKHTYSM
jgi:hypothetical protein